MGTILCYAMLAFLIICFTISTTSIFPRIANYSNKEHYKESLNSNPRWVSLFTESDALLLSLEPVGVENGIIMYLCRAEVSKNRYKTGKLWTWDGEFACIVSEYGHKTFKHFELLDAPPGTTSWVKVTAALPQHAILGGNHSDGAPIYVCRGTINGNLEVGSFLDKRNGGDCWIAMYSKEYKITSGVEVLVLNAFGREFQKE